MPSVTPHTAAEMLNAALQADLPILIIGSPGIGKSSIVRQQCELRPGWELRDLRLSQIESVDLRGIPTTEGGITRWNPPSSLPSEGEGILLLDELNSCSATVQAAAYELILERRLGEYTMPPGWRIVAAGNRTTDGALVNRMSTALKNRFITVEITSDLEEWVSWAYAEKIDPMVIAFLRFSPQSLNCFDQGTVNPAALAYNTQRSWEYVSDILAVKPSAKILSNMVMAAVGDGEGAAFMAFYKINDQLPTWECIVETPTTAPFPMDVSARYALVSLITARVTQKTFSKAFQYLSRFPAEFQTLGMRDITRVHPFLTATKEFSTWALANQDVIF